MTEVLTRTEQPQDQNDNNDFNSPEITGDFFIDPKVGVELFKIVDEHGQITMRSAGYKQLHINDGQNLLIATAYTATGHEAHGEPKIFHAIISPNDKLQPTTAISIPLATGIPIVTEFRNNPSSSSWSQACELGPEEAALEITRAIRLIARGLSKDTLESISPQEPIT